MLLIISQVNIMIVVIDFLNEETIAKSTEFTLMLSDTELERCRSENSRRGI